MHTFTFTDEQHSTLICALALAAQKYAHPEIVIETLTVINADSAQACRDFLAERDKTAVMQEP